MRITWLTRGLFLLRRLHIVQFILVFLMCFFLLQLISFAFPGNWADNAVVNGMSDSKKVVFGIFFGPWLETVIYQSLIIGGICFFIKRPRYNFILSIGLSSILFGLSHWFSVYYIIWATVGGVFMGVAYYAARYRTNWAFMPVFIIHATWNSIAFLADLLTR
ncbi:CPBP family intramembrane metalloprotease [Carboxylicivirga mesophila]|uniref:CPBP family intramembrane metalloprotease n=1 Tax=Carboxylicivirga mesophila TaxID=1166478 RepID=A0ABS5K474_9BACT|nr:CPBP family glutamic-type intramembrane protease [Carboxylicivirga mesophila]MBS2209825.1 CPBP family intramembrane metalloprotease [Carboxylicivirga mesophila]